MNDEKPKIGDPKLRAWQHERLKGGSIPHRRVLSVITITAILERPNRWREALKDDDEPMWSASIHGHDSDEMFPDVVTNYAHASHGGLRHSCYTKTLSEALRRLADSVEMSERAVEEYRKNPAKDRQRRIEHGSEVGDVAPDHECICVTDDGSPTGWCDLCGRMMYRTESLSFSEGVKAARENLANDDPERIPTKWRPSAGSKP